MRVVEGAAGGATLALSGRLLMVAVQVVVVGAGAVAQMVGQQGLRVTL